MRLIDVSRGVNEWILRVELSREEASILSTVFGVNICSTRLVNISDLLQKIAYTIISNQLRDTGGGCEASMIVSDDWLQIIAPHWSLGGKQLVDYISKVLGVFLKHFVEIARDLEDLRRGIVAPCIDSLISDNLKPVLGVLPLLCVKGHDKQLLEVIVGDGTPRYILRLLLKLNNVPDVMIKKWHRGLQPRIEGCLRPGESGDTVYIGDVKFRSSYYYVNDCIVVEGYISMCRDQARQSTIAKLYDLKLAETQKSIVTGYLKLIGDDSILDVRMSREWTYFRVNKPRDPIIEAELCLKT